MKGKQVVKILEGKGWRIARVSGSHYWLVKGGVGVTVPVHASKDIKKGTLKGIEKQTGVKLR